jgi:formylglycine-generating enzyme required for sulfatase activity
VISSEPAAGSSVNSGSYVNLLISKGPVPEIIVWASINDAGVTGHEGFYGQMSKYETTNALYCQFLNAALATGDITVSGTIVLGANGTNSGADFAVQGYYDLAGPGSAFNGAVNGGATRIHYSGGLFTVDSGYENHPVTFVSWCGATAYCNYYGYRLPTEWEWQAVADYDGTYLYGCGTAITNATANYLNSTHPDGTTVVGSFGDFGYGVCDMAGNVWEWTSSLSGGIPINRGGGWGVDASSCTVTYSTTRTNGTYPGVGFRVCR